MRNMKNMLTLSVITITSMRRSISQTFRRRIHFQWLKMQSGPRFTSHLNSMMKHCCYVIFPFAIKKSSENHLIPYIYHARSIQLQEYMYLKTQWLNLLLNQRWCWTRWMNQTSISKVWIRSQCRKNRWKAC